MNYHLQHLLTSVLLPLCVLGCTPDMSGPTSRPAGSPDPALPEAPLASYSYDVSGLSITPPSSLPQRRLSSAAFTPKAIAGTLIGTQEVFTLATSTGDRDSSESPSYTLEVDGRQGQILFLSKLPSGPTAEVLETDLAQQSLARLTAWGVDSDELGPVLPRRTLRDDSSKGQVTGPVLHRYKTFIARALGGIPVQGHRAVLTYTPDGVFHRALLIWPPLAASGHKLGSALSVDEIKGRADRALRNEGLASGPVKLHWKYLPTLQASGDVTLQLVVAAQARGPVQKAGLGEEPREFDIDVSAR